MESIYLLAKLIDALNEQKKVLDRDIASLEIKSNENGPYQEELTNELSEKKRQRALITKNAIEEYKVFWASLTSSDRLPCPFCYLFTPGKKSHLESLPLENGLDRVKCMSCKEIFYFQPE